MRKTVMPEREEPSPAEFTSIEPTPLESAAARPQPEPDGGGHWLNRALLGASLLLLLVCLIGVIFILPRWVAAPATSSVPTAPRETEAVAAPDTSTPTAVATPVDPETANVQREKAQALLAKIVELTDTLATRQAARWAEREYGEALAATKDGEKAYRERRYETALTTYTSTIGVLEGLFARVPEIVAQTVDEGLLALLSGDSLAATRAFEFALAIEPGHAPAVQGLARAKSLDRVLALVGQAEGYERLGKVDDALAAYLQALELDAQAPGAATAVARIRQDKTDERYRAAMSAGFVALGSDKFAEARAAFEQARKIKPHAEEAAAALKQTENRATSYRIDTLLAEAHSHEREEQWQLAGRKYNEALKLDDKLSPAIAGRTNARERALLDERIRQTITRPLRLSDNAVYAGATALYEQASRVPDPGPRLSGQLATLAQQVKDARIPIAVTLQSDKQTEVTIHRVAKLQRFDRRNVDLVPGHYTVIGTRDGYRDVRIEFDVLPRQPAPAIVVRCEEKIAFGN